MTIKEGIELTDKAIKLGIFTAQELQIFYNTEKIHNESLLETVRRYYNDYRKELNKNKIMIRIK